MYFTDRVSLRWSSTIAIHLNMVFECLADQKVSLHIFYAPISQYRLMHKWNLNISLLYSLLLASAGSLIVKWLRASPDYPHTTNCLFCLLTFSIRDPKPLGVLNSLSQCQIIYCDFSSMFPVRMPSTKYKVVRKTNKDYYYDSSWVLLHSMMGYQRTEPRPRSRSLSGVMRTHQHCHHSWALTLYLMKWDQATWL